MAQSNAGTDAELEAPTKDRRSQKSAAKDQGTEHSPRAGGGGLERVTVNLIPRASRALEQAGQLTGYSKTDTINRSLQVYAYLEEVWSKGGTVMVQIDDKVTELKFF